MLSRVSTFKSLQKRNLRKYATPKETKKTQILVIGGGSAGMAVSSILSKTNEVLIVDPSDKHFYQAAWTLSGGGLYPIEKTARSMSSVVPKSAELLKDEVVGIDAEGNSVQTRGGVKIEYDYLFVTSGIQINWDAIKGLPEALKDSASRVTSNYSYDYAPKTAKLIEEMKRGNAIFTQPIGLIKCAGAPQKIMYIAEDKWSKRKKKVDVKFFNGNPVIFSSPHYRDALWGQIEGRGIHAAMNRDLVEVRDNEAIFHDTQTGEEFVEKFSFLHVTPKQSAPDFIKESSLANEAGYVDVDKHTLQHVKYPNVFALGDCSSLPTSKTASAVAGQIPVAVSNFLSYKHGIEFTESYDGYTACPIVTKEGKVILAEFDYELGPKPTFPFVKETSESSFNYFLKRHVFPPLYWNGLIKGRWGGPNTLPWKKFSSKSKEVTHAH